MKYFTIEEMIKIIICTVMLMSTFSVNSQTLNETIARKESEAVKAAQLYKLKVDKVDPSDSIKVAESLKGVTIECLSSWKMKISNNRTFDIIYGKNFIFEYSSSDILNTEESEYQKQIRKYGRVLTKGFIKLGDSEIAVLNSLGRPDKRSCSGKSGDVHLYYGSKGRYSSVFLENGKVTEYFTNY